MKKSLILVSLIDILTGMRYETILHRGSDVPFTIVTIALRKVMGWDFCRAYQVCQDVIEKGECTLAISDQNIAHDYVKLLSRYNLLVSCNTPGRIRTEALPD